jgi:hypothetical protein
MTARIPYLAGLAGPGSAEPVLLPPRPLFAGSHGQPRVRSGGPATFLSAGQDAAEDLPGAWQATQTAAAEPTSAPPGASLRRAEPGADRPVTALGPAGMDGAERAPASPLLPRPAVSPPTRPGPTDRSESSLPAGGSLAAPGPPGVGRDADHGGGARGDTHPDLGIAARPSPRFWTDPLWGAPVELPPAVSARPLQRAGDTTQSAGTAASGALLPSSGQAQQGNDRPGPHTVRERRRQHGVPEARVSIGTIEVTVVPPAPQPGHPEDGPARPRPGRQGAASLLAVGPGAERLRDGLRRWHGTAQG